MPFHTHTRRRESPPAVLASHLTSQFPAGFSIMTTISVQPGMTMAAGTKISTWSSGLCDCCEDMSTCCFGFWCPCCLMCTTSQEFGECLCLPLLDMCFGPIIPPAAYSLRSAMRERYRIQMARELKLRRQPQVFVNPPVNVTYTAPVSASYQPVVNPSYQSPPMNPAYQPQSGGMYPAV
ncbi:plac8 onzin related protein 6 [Silurus meridionalis]|nr:plac8 onzin related protein 6 [Silurus meridionalis]